MHQLFLAWLREYPADLTTWLVYADWLEERGELTGPFIRLSLQLTTGQVPRETAEACIAGFERLYAAAHSETRQLLATYRSTLPTRFRVLHRFFIGEDPPREMFGYARTVAVGFLEAGRIRPGMNLDVGCYADGRPRLLQAILLLDRNVEELATGQEPIQAGLGWLGHLEIEVGSLLTVVPATVSTQSTEPSATGGQPEE
jgi:uncharacterized protein (TIGR02996 family)